MRILKDQTYQARHDDGDLIASLTVKDNGTVDLFVAPGQVGVAGLADVRDLIEYVLSIHMREVPPAV